MLKFKIPSDKKEYDEYKNSLLNYIECQNIIEVFAKIANRGSFYIEDCYESSNNILIISNSETKLSLHEEIQNYSLNFLIDIKKDLRDQNLLDLLIIAVLLGFKDYKIEYN
jgi:hypothetical protein